jgi:kinesin family protein C1
MKKGSLKRKVVEEELSETADQPRKLPAIGGVRRVNDVLRPSRTATNQPYKSMMPAPLTKPRAPNLATASTKRATSAPPKSLTRSASATTATTAAAASRPATRAAASRTAFNPARNSADIDTETRLNSIEFALAASTAQMEACMKAERAKFAELQASHLALSRQLANTNTTSLTHRRELDTKSDELEAERRKYKRELEELEAELRRKERREREAVEDLRAVRDDLERERDVISQLKSTISQQSTAQLALKTQNEALQAQGSAIQAGHDVVRAENVRLRLELENALLRVKELEEEARDAEGHRRKLHNMVQELKGNIRVFCRVRPMLPAERDDEAPDAGWEFPDKHDKKEIVVSSLSESATGQERKEVYNFAFDRVSHSGSDFRPSFTHLA